MKMPNGYGSVVKLSGARRKPWAVRTSYLEEQPDGTVKRKQRYIAYFVEQKHALTYLAELNNGNIIKEHQKYTDVPTFAELYGKWKTFRKTLKSNPSASTWRNYEIAFNMFSSVHHQNIVSLRAQDLQECITAQSSKSRATIGSMRAIVRGMWSYAINNDYTEKDITEKLVFEFTDSTTPIHTRFTDKEIKLLWESLGVVNNVDIILIYIYTGLRPSELLEITRENVHLDERYMIGGLKTENGINRIIPLHKAIIPLIENRLNQNRPYLITNKYGNHYSLKVYHNSNWNTVMNKLKLNHAPHDGRYTFASLADNACMNTAAKKIIMGHSIANVDGTAFKSGDKSDITLGTYTEKTLPELLTEIDKLPTSF